MKKSYEKPMIYAESFELDQCIATCKVNSSQTGTNQYRNNCVIITDDGACLIRNISLQKVQPLVQVGKHIKMTSVQIHL